jgi:four helix bundle protein
MNKEELLLRTKNFAIRVFKLCDGFKKSEGSRVITYQLLKSSSSVAANYRATNRAKSTADFINKLKIVLEEADESNFWLTFALEVGLVSGENVEVNFLIKESDEFVAILTASIKTLNNKRR